MIPDQLFIFNEFESNPIMAWAVVGFFVIIFIEMYISYQEEAESYDIKDAWASISMGIGSAIFNSFSTFLAFLLFFWI